MQLRKLRNFYAMKIWSHTVAQYEAHLHWQLKTNHVCAIMQISSNHGLCYWKICRGMWWVVSPYRQYLSPVRGGL